MQRDAIFAEARYAGRDHTAMHAGRRDANRSVVDSAATSQCGAEQHSQFVNDGANAINLLRNNSICVCERVYICRKKRFRAD